MPAALGRTKLQKTWTIEQTASALQRELIARIDALLPGDGYRTFPGLLHLSRASATVETARGIYEPTFCVVAQGKKVMETGGERFVYDPARFLLTSVAMPVATRVLEASTAQPYMCAGLVLDPALIGSVMMEAALPPSDDSSLRAVEVARIDTPLLDAVVRLIRVLEEPRDTAVLAPLAQREIIYRLLRGPQGARLRQIAPLGGPTHRVAQAVEWLRGHVDQPVRIDALAKHVGMSSPGLHHYFRAVTGMSPLQYLKQVRLTEARRLLVQENFDAATAGFRVGYNDASQFNREYRRLFGAPPMRDVRTTGMRRADQRAPALEDLER